MHCKERYTNKLELSSAVFCSLCSFTQSSWYPHRHRNHPHQRHHHLGLWEPRPRFLYIIQYRAKSPDSKYETVDSITTTRYSIGGLYPNTEYEIRVSAVNSIGQGPPSNRVEARTGRASAGQPTEEHPGAHLITERSDGALGRAGGAQRLDQGLSSLLHHGSFAANEQLADPQRSGQHDNDHPQPRAVRDVHHPCAGLHVRGRRTLL